MRDRVEGLTKVQVGYIKIRVSFSVVIYASFKGIVVVNGQFIWYFDKYKQFNEERGVFLVFLLVI